MAEGHDIAIRARTPPLEDRASRCANSGSATTSSSPALPSARTICRPPCRRTSTGCRAWATASPNAITAGTTGPGGATATIAYRPRLASDDMHTLRAAAVAGLGVVQLPAMLLGDELRSGRLVRLLPEWSSKGAVVHAVFLAARAAAFGAGADRLPGQEVLDELAED
ncbi:MAG: LysR substrate-binding domain-containing protein [Rubrivivax sp.]